MTAGASPRQAGGLGAAAGQDDRGAAPRGLLIACGALAGVLQPLRQGPLQAYDLTCLPANLHNRPGRLAAALREKIRSARAKYDRIVCVYGDCGTGGELDRMLEEEDAPRLAGPHCYAFLAGEAEFTALAEAEPGTFFLTDFLARHFERLVIAGLGLDRRPELRDAYFGAYRRLVYLAQTDDSALDALAETAAKQLGLAYERRFTGLSGLLSAIEAAECGAP